MGEIIHNHFSAFMQTHFLSSQKSAHTFCHRAHNLTHIWHRLKCKITQIICYRRREGPGCAMVVFSPSLRSETSWLNNSPLGCLCRMRWSLSDTQISFKFSIWKAWETLHHPVTNFPWSVTDLVWNIVQVSLQNWSSCTHRSCPRNCFHSSFFIYCWGPLTLQCWLF